MVSFFAAYDVLSRSGLFDTDFYLSSVPDDVGGLDPLTHYIEIGAAERRNPGPAFDTEFYLQQCATVGITPEIPLLHYLQEGAALGLQVQRPPSATDATAAIPELSIEDLLEPGPVRQVRLDLTTRCNLRCTYCAVSQPSYVGTDMPDDVLDQAVSTIISLSRLGTIRQVDVNGYGETTYREGWTNICFSLVDNGIPVCITSNLARAYSEKELEALACLDHIAISIDTNDRALLARMRRKVDVRQIVMNIIQVRQAALKMHRKPPAFGFICGLYEQNTLQMEDFARFAVAMGIRDVSFWNLDQYAYEGTDIPLEDRAMALDKLPPDRLVPRLRSIAEALDILKRHGITTNVHGDFVKTLADAVSIDGRTDRPGGGKRSPAGMDSQLL
jgi:hypothetical protein